MCVRTWAGEGGGEGWEVGGRGDGRGLNKGREKRITVKVRDEVTEIVQQIKHRRARLTVLILMRVLKGQRLELMIDVKGHLSSFTCTTIV